MGPKPAYFILFYSFNRQCKFSTIQDMLRVFACHYIRLYKQGRRALQIREGRDVLCGKDARFFRRVVVNIGIARFSAEIVAAELCTPRQAHG